MSESKGIFVESKGITVWVNTAIWSPKVLPNGKNAKKAQNKNTFYRYLSLLTNGRNDIFCLEKYRKRSINNDNQWLLKIKNKCSKRVHSLRNQRIEVR